VDGRLLRIAGLLSNSRRVMLSRFFRVRGTVGGGNAFGVAAGKWQISRIRQGKSVKSKRGNGCKLKGGGGGVGCDTNSGERPCFAEAGGDGERTYPKRAREKEKEFLEELRRRKIKRRD